MSQPRVTVNFYFALQRYDREYRLQPSFRDEDTSKTVHKAENLKKRTPRWFKRDILGNPFLGKKHETFTTRCYSCLFCVDFYF